MKDSQEGTLDRSNKIISNVDFALSSQLIRMVDNEANLGGSSRSIQISNQFEIRLNNKKVMFCRIEDKVETNERDVAFFDNLHSTGSLLNSMETMMIMMGTKSGSINQIEGVDVINIQTMFLGDSSTTTNLIINIDIIMNRT